ncbi:hypothetical protein ACR79N_26820 [Sphingobacterium siyangense]|uniref:hypothetical protein n=1 Tax=Sphingobacterium siyangense TaxID=459529 RepID=UPI003DA28F66
MDRSLDVQFLILYLKENHFKQGWAKVPAGIKLDDYKEVLVYNIISASIEIFKFYLLLFLSGEYIVIPENNDNDIDKIVEFLREEADEIEKVRSQKLKLELQSKFQDNLFFTIEEIIKLNIVYFNRDLTTQLDLDYKKGLFRGNKLSERIGDIDEGLMQYIEAFRLVISLTRLEHFLFSASQKLIKDLLVIEKQIHYLSIEEKLKKAISVKASFLLKKLIYRLKGKDLDSSPTLIYAFNQEEDVSVELDKIQLDSNLERWEHLIKVHYGYISNFKQEQRKRRKEIENKENSNYCYALAS